MYTRILAYVYILGLLSGIEGKASLETNKCGTYDRFESGHCGSMMLCVVHFSVFDRELTDTILVLSHLSHRPIGPNLLFA